MIIRRCPVCKGKTLEYMVWLGKYRCKKCNYFGPLFIKEVRILKRKKK